MSVNMKTIKSFLTAFFVVTFLNGCKDESVNPPGNSTFYPLNVGNSWVYNSKTYDSLGVLINESQFEEKLPSTVLKDGQSVYEYDSPLYYVHNDKRYLQLKSDGLHILLGSLSGTVWYDESLRYKYPCVINDFFTNGRNGTDTTFVTSLSESIVCEAGTFDCIVYKNLYKEDDGTSLKVVGYGYDYVSFSIGKVKSELYLINNNQQYIKSFEYSLKSYSVN